MYRNIFGRTSLLNDGFYPSDSNSTIDFVEAEKQDILQDLFAFTTFFVPLYFTSSTN